MNIYIQIEFFFKIADKEGWMVKGQLIDFGPL